MKSQSQYVNNPEEGLKHDLDNQDVWESDYLPLSKYKVINSSEDSPNHRT